MRLEVVLKVANRIHFRVKVTAFWSAKGVRQSASQSPVRVIDQTGGLHFVRAQALAQSLSRIKLHHRFPTCADDFPQPQVFVDMAEVCAGCSTSCTWYAPWYDKCLRCQPLSPSTQLSPPSLFYSLDTSPSGQSTQDNSALPLSYALAAHKGNGGQVRIFTWRDRACVRACKWLTCSA